MRGEHSPSAEAYGSPNQRRIVAFLEFLFMFLYLLRSGTEHEYRYSSVTVPLLFRTRKILNHARIVEQHEYRVKGGLP